MAHSNSNFSICRGKLKMDEWQDGPIAYIVSIIFIVPLIILDLIYGKQRKKEIIKDRGLTKYFKELKNKQQKSFC